MCEAPETKMQEKLVGDGPTGLLCVCGPLGGKRHVWDGSKDARLVIDDKEKPWLKHVYLYTHLSGVDAQSGVQMGMEFWAYAGPEGM